MKQTVESRITSIMATLVHLASGEKDGSSIVRKTSSRSVCCLRAAAAARISSDASDSGSEGRFNSSSPAAVSGWCRGCPALHGWSDAGATRWRCARLLAVVRLATLKSMRVARPIHYAAAQTTPARHTRRGAAASAPARLRRCSRRAVTVTPRSVFSFLSLAAASYRNVHRAADAPWRSISSARRARSCGWWAER